jgi:hypothetical protein
MSTPAGFGGVLELDGVVVTLSRSRRDGRIMIEIDTVETEGGDVWEPGGVPRLRLVVNDDVGNLDPDGEFDWGRA